MIPVIALVGRPNVGKSTLFNYLTGTRDALVANFPGLTRDRKYGETDRFGKKAVVVDTGGISGGETGIDSFMAEQSRRAMDEADIILFMVDCKDGLTSADQEIAQYLREKGSPVFLAANKVDGSDPDVATGDFYQLGLGEVHAISATHGRGVRKLFQLVFESISSEEEAEDIVPNEKSVRIAVVGRPNVGKSTLVNRLLGEERVVVYDQPGTTRDSIYINYERNDTPYTLIDTAGVRRRKNVKLTVEKFSIVKTLQAIADANVVILLLDGRENIVDQDLHLMGHSIDAGKALVVAVNKWDGLDEYQRQQIKSELDRRLRFVDFADVHYISALHGTNVGHLYKSIEDAWASATKKFSTNHLTQILLSLPGVRDVFIHETDLVAHIKVNKKIFDNAFLEDLRLFGSEHSKNEDI